MIITKKDYPKIKDLFIKQDPNLIFLYGQNDGLKEIISKKLENQFNADAKYIYTLEDVLSDKNVFLSQIFETDFFISKKIIKLYNYEVKIINVLKFIIEKLISLNNVKIIIIAEDLDKKSSTYKQLELNDKIFLISCYYDELKDTEIRIKQFLNENQIKINNENLNFLVKKLNGDSLILESELDKIKLYFYNKNDKVLNEEYLESLIDHSIIFIDSFLDSFGLMKITDATFYLNKLLQNDFNIIQIIKILKKHFEDLYLKKCRIQYENSTIELETKFLFFKRIANVREQLKMFSIQQIKKIIFLIQNLESKSIYYDEKYSIVMLKKILLDLKNI